MALSPRSGDIGNLHQQGELMGPCSQARPLFHHRPMRSSLSLGVAIGFVFSAVACGSDSPGGSPSDGGRSAAEAFGGSGGGPLSGTGGASVDASGGAPLGGSTSVSGSGGVVNGSTGGAAPGSSGGVPASGGAAMSGGSGGDPLQSTGGAPESGTGGASIGGSGGGAAESHSGGSAAGGDEGALTGGSAGSAAGGAGGDGAAGQGTGGESVPPLYVTSGPDEYWNSEAPVTVLTSGVADLVVDPAATYQEWDGFGGTFNEMGWDALSAVSSEISQAMTLLFGDDYANFVYGRVPMGASDYAMSWYTYAETPNDFAMENFSIARDREMLIPYIRAALDVEPNLRLWGSPWVVPDWMKDGMALKSDPQTLEAHALYFAKFVEEYANEGLTIEAVHPQNEPGYARVRWPQSVLAGYFKSYLGPKFVERGLTTEIWCGTMSHPDDANIALAVAEDPEAMQYVTGFGLQWNHEDTVALLAPAGRVMQTEHRCGNYDFEAKYWDQSRYSSTMPQNDHLYGEESWRLIRDWIVGGVNSYLAWNMVLDTQGRSLDGWPQNALLVVDRAERRLIVTPAYYAFRHFSQYITPGATRIGISGSEDAVAFSNPDGSVVVNLYNGSASQQTKTIEVSEGLYQLDIPAHGWATLRAGASG